MTNRAERLRKWAQTSQSSRHMNAIPKHAAPYMSVKASEFDSDPFLLNVLNGTLVIRREPSSSVSISLKPHDPRDMITKVCPVKYDPAATCPVYDAALAHVQPDPDVRDFLHRMIGYGATGDTSEQKLFFFYGGGRNGKSTFVDTWAYVLGDYATSIPIETFLAAGGSRYGGQPSPHLARLAGIRMLRTSEAERGAVLAEALIKLATSNEPMLVRHLNKAFFELRPQFKLIISGNYKPRIKGTDDGIWRRIILVPWPVKIVERDLHLAEKLKAEGSGILNRILQGKRHWLELGLAPPEAILDATAEYRSASDHLGRFLDECTQPELGGRLAAQDLYELFAAWAKATGAPVWTRTGLGRAMSDRGYKNTKSGNHFWLDTKLTKRPEDFDVMAEQPPGPEEPPPLDDEEVL
jgi:putative DNA primase/helicase